MLNSRLMAGKSHSHREDYLLARIKRFMGSNPSERVNGTHSTWEVQNHGSLRPTQMKVELYQDQKRNGSLKQESRRTSNCKEQRLVSKGRQHFKVFNKIFTNKKFQQSDTSISSNTISNKLCEKSNNVQSKAKSPREKMPPQHSNNADRQSKDLNNLKIVESEYLKPLQIEPKKSSRKAYICHGQRNQNTLSDSRKCGISQQARKNIQARRRFIENQQMKVYELQPLYPKASYKQQIQNESKTANQQYKYLRPQIIKNSGDAQNSLKKNANKENILNQSSKNSQREESIIQAKKAYIIRQEDQFTSSQLPLQKKTTAQQKILIANQAAFLSENSDKIQRKIGRENIDQYESEVGISTQLDTQLRKNKQLQKISEMNQDINHRIRNIMSEFQNYLQQFEQTVHSEKNSAQ